LCVPAVRRHASAQGQTINDELAAIHVVFLIQEASVGAI